MKNQLVKFLFNESEIEFDVANNIMVNATEMAKIFGKQVESFLRNEETKNFISECLKNENSSFLNIKTEEDLVSSKQKSGTWMHRVLALKFAAWLNPAFELWIYCTIEQLLFGENIERNKLLERKANIKYEKQQLVEKLKDNEDFKKLNELNAEEMRLGKDTGTIDKQIVERQFTLLFNFE